MPLRRKNLNDSGPGSFRDAVVTPTFTVSSASNGSVTLPGDSHTARFQPAAGFKGRGSFTFGVKGSDNTSFTSRVLVLVTP